MYKLLLEFKFQYDNTLSYQKTEYFLSNYPFKFQYDNTLSQKIV